MKPSDMHSVSQMIFLSLRMNVVSPKPIFSAPQESTKPPWFPSLPRFQGPQPRAYFTYTNFGIRAASSDSAFDCLGLQPSSFAFAVIRSSVGASRAPRTFSRAFAVIFFGLRDRVDRK